MPRYVWHCMDVGEVLESRKVDACWQYETLVRFGGCEHGMKEWIPTIELSFIRA